MIKPLSRIIVFFSVLAAVGLACQINLGGAKPQYPTAVASAQDTQSLETTWATAVQVQSQNISVSLTEQQINATIVQQLQSESVPMLANPQVYLRNGQIEVYGQVENQGVAADAKVVVKPVVLADGRVDMQLLSATVGPFPIPDSMLGDINRMLNKFSSDYLASATQELKIETIVIADGVMTISGTKR